MNEKKLYSAIEVCEKLNISTWTLSNWYRWERKLLNEGAIKEPYLPEPYVVTNKKGKPRVKKLTELSYKDAFLIGLFQALSLIPGTSRSGSTILGGITIGTSRRVASEFTFFLAVPAMLGASFLKIIKFGFAFSAMEFVILINGMITAFTVSLLVIKFLMDFIKKHNFNIFGIYRIILGAIVLATYIFSR